MPANENIACIFCGTHEDSVYIEENGYEGRKCRECGLIYISPRPSQEDIADIYGHDDANLSAEAHTGSEVAKRRHAKHILKMIRKHISGGNLLEIGAGGGFFLDEARKIGFSPHAIELNPNQARFMRDELSIACEEAPLSQSSFGDGLFDMIFHCDVVSHFYDPFAEFERMREKLNPGGVMAFETGNLGDVDKSYLRFVPSFQYPDHLFFFSERNIHDLLERTGFELLEIRRYSILPQLRMTHAKRALNSLRRRSTPAPGTSPSRGQSFTRSQPVSSPRSGLKKHLNSLWIRSEHLARYRIGRIVPKKHKPQTILIIARRPSGQ